MEIAAGQDLALGREYQRVVGDRVGLAFDHGRGRAEHVEGGAHDLGLAAQGVGILDPVTFQMRGADAAVRQQPSQHPGHCDLPGLAAGLGDAGVDGHVAAERRIDAHGAGRQRRGEDVEPGEQAVERQRGGDLGAVQQRQALLGAELDRRQAGALERRRRGQGLARQHDLALAQQHRGELGERRQVARGADRALGGQDRKRVGVEQGQECFDHAAPDARAALGECVDLEQEHQAGDPRRERRTDAGAMGQHHPALQLGDLVGVDGGFRQAAEAGIDAVDAAPLPEHGGDGFRRGLDGAVAAWVERDRTGATPQGPQLREGQGPGSELKRLRFGHERASSANRLLRACLSPKARGQKRPRARIGIAGSAADDNARLNWRISVRGLPGVHRHLAA